MSERRESIAEEPKIAIVSDPDEVRALLKEGHAKAFATLLLETNFSPDDLREETRVRLQTNGVLFPDGAVPVDHEMRDTDEWTETHTLLTSDYKKLAKDEHLFLAIKGKEIVGVCGYDGVGYKDGREVYELKRVVVDPNHRGEKISQLLIGAATKKIHAVSPEAYALSYTKQTQWKRNMERFNAKELSVVEYVDIDYPEANEDRKDAIERRTQKAERGWKAYLLDLKKD